MEDHSRPATGYPATGYPLAAQPSNYPTTTGTAYPYVAPPPQAAYYNPNPYYAQRATFRRRFFAILIAFFIISGTIAFITWLIFRPRLPQFRVDSVTLSNFNLSSSPSLITGNWDVRFTARNPNKKLTLYYDHIEASIFYKAESLSDTTVPPFVQGRKNQTAVRATFAAVSAYVVQWVAYGINADRTSRGTVNFNVRMLARVRFKAGSWRARRRFLRIYCGELPVGLSSNRARGTLVGGPIWCKVGL